MGTSGDKIVLLDGMGSGSGSAANGLLSMIPGMFTSLLGGNKMDPNLVAALMNGRNNQDQTQALAAKIDLQTQIINDKFCQLEMREMQNTIQQLREEKQALATSAITQQQTQNIVSQLAPKAPVPAYVVQNPGCCYTPTVRVANECGCACGTTNAVL